MKNKDTPAGIVGKNYQLSKSFIRYHRMWVTLVACNLSRPQILEDNKIIYGNNILKKLKTGS